MRRKPKHQPNPEPNWRNRTSWNEAVARDAALSFARVPFDHPLWILYSSGTTGLSKGSLRFFIELAQRLNSSGEPS